MNVSISTEKITLRYFICIFEQKSSAGSTGSGIRAVSPHLSSKGSSSSLASSPPGVQFCVGTPPTNQNAAISRRNSVPVQYGVSPARQTGMLLYFCTDQTVLWHWTKVVLVMPGCDYIIIVVISVSEPSLQSLFVPISNDLHIGL